MTTEPKPEHKAWAKYLIGTLPDHNINVFCYYDDTKERKIDILTGRNKDGVVAATIGVMELDQGNNVGVEVHTEILMDCRGENEYIGNVISTIAFFMIKDRWKAAPGVVFETMIEMYAPDLEVKHALFVPPIQWGEGMGEVVLGSKTIYPLLAVPITDNENEFLLKEGASALEELWTEKNVDVFDWRRHSAV